jgi:hypothetical protein
MMDEDAMAAMRLSIPPAGAVLDGVLPRFILQPHHVSSSKPDLYHVQRRPGRGYIFCKETLNRSSLLSHVMRRFTPGV